MAGASISRRSIQPQEKREVKYVVRAPDSNNRGKWVTVGVAFEQWDGTLILLPPLLPDDEPAADE